MFRMVCLLGEEVTRSRCLPHGKTSECSRGGCWDDGCVAVGVKALFSEPRGEERSLLLSQLLQLDMVANAHKLSSQDPKAGESQVQGQPALHVSSGSA